MSKFETKVCEPAQVIMAVSSKIGFYANFDKIFIKNRSIIKKIDNFLKEKSYVFMEYPYYEDIYFDGKESGP